MSKLPSGLKPAAIMAERKPHGTRMKYRGGCRCLGCRVANANYAKQRELYRKTGNSNPFVSAETVRRHLVRLSELGIGYRAVHEACGVSSSSLARISAGKKTLIRRRTEERVLDVRAVSAHTAWLLIDRMCAEGFTRGQILNRLNCKDLRRLPQGFITTVTAAKVDRLFRRIAA